MLVAGTEEEGMAAEGMAAEATVEEEGRLVMVGLRMEEVVLDLGTAI